MIGSGPDREDGSATIVAAALIGLLVTVGAALGVVSALFVAHRTAQAAADLSALAGARTLAEGGDGCAAADRIALANRARLVDCSVAGREMTVGIVVEGPRWLGQAGDLSAQARAGPERAGAADVGLST